MSRQGHHVELREKTQQLLQGSLKHVRAAALAAALVPLASVAVSTAVAQDQGSGGTADAVFLVIDEDSIDNGNPPNVFSAEDVNDDIAEIGVRAQLRFFAQNAGARRILHTGQVGDEGWFALKTIPDSWMSAGPTRDGLWNYLVAGPGLGTRNRRGDRESRLDKVPDVTPLRATGLRMLEGQTVCAVVYDSDVSMNYDPLNGSLKGATLGVVAFQVLAVTRLQGYSSSSLPEVEIEIQDAAQVCAGPLMLFADAPTPTSSSTPQDVDPYPVTVVP